MCRRQCAVHVNSGNTDLTRPGVCRCQFLQQVLEGEELSHAFIFHRLQPLTPDVVDDEVIELWFTEALSAFTAIFN